MSDTLVVHRAVPTGGKGAPDAPPGILEFWSETGQPQPVQGHTGRGSELQGQLPSNALKHRIIRRALARAFFGHTSVTREVDELWVRMFISTLSFCGEPEPSFSGSFSIEEEAEEGTDPQLSGRGYWSLLLGQGAPTEQSGVALQMESPAGCGAVSRDWDEVRNYLDKHPDLASLLPEICERARKEFGVEAELALEVYEDPEIDDRCLTLYVRQEQYDPQIMERIETVNQQFNDELEQVSGYFLLATDFRKPREAHGV